MKIILLILDGLGDRSYPELDHQTPLQAARTPNMDRLATIGANGVFHAASPGVALPSEIAHFLLFGYDISEFPGRGLLEAVGAAVPFDDKAILSLAHLAKVRFEKNSALLVQGRDDVEGSAQELAKYYRQIESYEAAGISCKLHQIQRNDAILVVSGDVSPDVSDSDPVLLNYPIALIQPLGTAAEFHKAGQTADFLNNYLFYCHDRLSRKHPKAPVNCLVTQRFGQRRVLPSFKEKWGLKAQMHASGDVYKGMAEELGMAFVKYKDTESPGKDLTERISDAISDGTYDFIHVHTKTPDAASHKGDPWLKKQVIESLDAAMTELVDALNSRSDILLVLTADHSTPCRSRMVHSGETVPLTIAGGSVRRDRVNQFDEVSAVAGSLGQIRGRELMQMVLNSADRSLLAGLCLGSRQTAYIPGPGDYARHPLKKWN